ncbi:MAG TPA: CdaR family protein [Chloroflexota bacterium]|jgi:YbbR domain-containing protein|nr:CdaR family protein [Chloroflexota bacterium]
MLIFLQRNLAWMLLAIALATALWIVVTTQQNPDVVDVFQAIQVETRNKPEDLVLRNEVPTVQVTVAAPRDVMQDLRPAKFQATIDLSRLGPGLQQVPIRVQTVDPRARIEEINPQQVLVHLEKVEHKSVPTRAKLTAELPTGYRHGAAKVTPENVVATGPESLVGQVVAVVAEVDLTGLTASVSQTYRASPQNANGERIDRISLSSENLLVELRIDQEKMVKTVPIAPQITGAVAPGYQPVGFRAEPTAITVEGDPAAVEALGYAPTRPVDLKNATGDVSVNAELQLPPGVRLTVPQPIVVRVFVSPVEGSKAVEIAPTIQGLGAGLRATVSPPAVRLTVKGPMPVLTALGPSEAKVVVDAAGLTPGVHQLPPRVEVPALVRLQSVDPERVELRIVAVEPTATAVPPPSPTPSPTRAPP